MIFSNHQSPLFQSDHQESRKEDQEGPIGKSCGTRMIRVTAKNRIKEWDLGALQQ